MSTKTLGNYYARESSSGHSLIASELTGASVAVAYAAKDGPLLAAAPELLETLADAEFLLRMLVKNPDDVGSMIDSLKRCADDARFIISNIEDAQNA